jgi:hypothetical protein
VWTSLPVCVHLPMCPSQNLHEPKEAKNRFCNKHLFLTENGLSERRQPGRRSGAPTKVTKTSGWAQGPGRKGDAIHRVSQQCEVATRISPGARRLCPTEPDGFAERRLRQLVHIQTEGAAATRKCALSGRRGAYCTVEGAETVSLRLG